MNAPILPTKRTRVPPIFENIMRFIATNPAATLAEGAAFFGVTVRWYGSVVNSDLFQARYQEWMAELDNKVLLPTLADKVKGAASLAIERLTDVLAAEQVPQETILKATDILLRAVSPKGPATQINVQQNNSFTLDPRVAAVSDARRAALEAARGQALPTIDLEPMSEAERAGLLEAQPKIETVELSPDDLAID